MSASSARPSLVDRLGKKLSELYTDSPRQNVGKLKDRIFGPERPKPAAAAHNKVLVGLLVTPLVADLVRHQLLRRGVRRALLAADAALLARFEAGPDQVAPAFSLQPCSWSESLENLRLEEDATLVLGLVPVEQGHWDAVRALKARYSQRVFLLPELLLPFTRIAFLQERLDYYIKTFEAILPFYLGRKFFGPLDKLNAHFPIAGKSVIEFGPFEGCQTAGLVHLGASRVTCIEARPENATKTRAACDVFGWEQVQVIMDDFHNADAAKVGRHDLAFAHGVYYHSIAPFLFLENLRTLSDTIFLGGFCATEDSPAGPFAKLAYEGQIYRVKQYREANNFTAGVNRYGYFFHKEDLIRFFRERGHQVTVITDEPMPVTAGNYSRLLITR